MIETKVEVCYNLDQASRPDLTTGQRNNYEARGCYDCAGNNKGCKFYVPTIKTSPERAKEWPYEIIEVKNDRR